MSLDTADALNVLAQADCLHDEAEVAAAYDKLAAEITAEDRKSVV